MDMRGHSALVLQSPGRRMRRWRRGRWKRCCNRSNLPGANTVRVLMGHPPSTTEWTANDTNGFSRFHARLPKRHILPTTILKQSFVDGAQYLLLFLSQGDHTSESKAALGIA